ncbi:MAG: outer membrane protein assembly factor BamB family protein [Candidatus Thorarchaeota archaeon]
MLRKEIKIVLVFSALLLLLSPIAGFYSSVGESTNLNTSETREVELVQELDIHTLSSNEDDWTMFGYNSVHTSTTTNIIPSSLKEKWTYDIGEFMCHNSPVVSQGMVFINDYAGMVYAFDMFTGTQIWNYTTGSYLFNTPAVSGDTIFVGAGDTKVYALDIASGESIWNFTTSGNIQESSPIISDGYLFVGNTDGDIYSIDISTGLQEWVYDVGIFSQTSPCVSSDTVFTGNANGDIYALTKASGTFKWSFPTGADTKSSPCFYDDMVFFGSNDDSFYAVNADDGSERWSYLTGGDVISSPAISDGIVCVGSNDNYLYALNLYTGIELWSFQTSAKVESSPSISNGIVYFSSWDGYFYAVDLYTGSELWRTNIGAYAISSPALAHGMIFIGSYDDDLYAFDAVPEEITKELDIEIATGSNYLRGEFSEFYFTTSVEGDLFDVTMTRADLVHSNGTVFTDLLSSVTNLDTGFYRIAYNIPSDAPVGTYNLLVQSEYSDGAILAKGVALESFQISSSFVNWDNWLLDILGDLAVIQTDTGQILIDIESLNATIISLDGTLLQIETNLGVISADISNLALESTLLELEDTIAIINTTLGTVSADISDIILDINVVEHELLHINTLLGSINGSLIGIVGDLVVIDTVLGSIQTEIEGWNAFSLSSTVGDSVYEVWFLSNSSISSSTYNDNSFMLELEGEDGTQGLTHVWIPYTMLDAIGSDSDQLTVSIDDETLQFTSSLINDRMRISFLYPHSTHTVVINLGSAEFPVILLVAIVGSVGLILVTVLVLRKRNRS